MNNKKLEILRHLKELRAERERLFDRLEESLLVESLWADAFVTGKCTCSLLGDYTSLEALYLRVDNGKEIRQYKISIVPRPLAKKHLTLLIRQLRENSNGFSADRLLREIRASKLFEEVELV